MLTQFHNATAKHKIPQGEPESLASAMDHSLRMAQTAYRHEQRKFIAKVSHKIKHLLQINRWQEEEKRREETIRRYEFNEEL